MSDRPLPATGATLTSPASSDELRLARVRQLAVVYAPQPGRRTLITLGLAPVTIGRDDSADLAIPDAEISRIHARVEHDDTRDVYVVVDCGSRNGLFVDGEQRDRADLASGSVIRIGGSLVVFTDHTVSPSQRLVPETPELLGHGLSMQRVRGEIELVAPSGVGVLIMGETGVGKERVAAAVHARSGCSGRFVALNCAAVPETLAESELFGHTAGAFTGAATPSDGLFVAAHQGTLFLDEIGELSPALQAKLLRVLATGEVRPVGATVMRNVDVRVVAATHRDLEEAVAAGTFRGDLYARLSAWVLRVPPLRDRREDILRLARAFLRRSGDLGLGPSAAESLLLWDWPYNVRELEQTIAAAVVRAGGADALRLEHLREPMTASLARRGETRPARATAMPPLAARIDRSATPTREELLEILAHYGGNLAAVATFFGKDRRQIYRWLDRYGIDPSTQRDPGT